MSKQATMLSVTQDDVERIQERGFCCLQTQDGEQFVIAHRDDQTEVMEILHNGGVQIDIRTVSDRD